METTRMMTGKERNRLDTILNSVCLFVNGAEGYDVTVNVGFADKMVSMTLFRTGKIIEDTKLIETVHIWLDNRFEGKGFDAAMDRIAAWVEAYEFGGKKDVHG